LNFSPGRSHRWQTITTVIEKAGPAEGPADRFLDMSCLTHAEADDLLEIIGAFWDFLISTFVFVPLEPGGGYCVWIDTFPECFYNTEGVISCLIDIAGVILDGLNSLSNRKPTERQRRRVRSLGIGLSRVMVTMNEIPASWIIEMCLSLDVMSV
jgi:hypothetical protein